MFKKTLVLLAIIAPQANAISEDRLTCKTLDQVMMMAGQYTARAFCSTAENKCRLQKLMDEKVDKTDIARLQIEDQLKAQIEYELANCEVFIKSQRLKIPRQQD